MHPRTLIPSHLGLQGKRIGTLDYFYDTTTADPGVLAVYNNTLMNLTSAGVRSVALIIARAQTFPKADGMASTAMQEVLDAAAATIYFKQKFDHQSVSPADVPAQEAFVCM